MKIYWWLMVRFWDASANMPGPESRYAQTLNQFIERARSDGKTRHDEARQRLRNTNDRVLGSAPSIPSFGRFSIMHDARTHIHEITNDGTNRFERASIRLDEELNRLEPHIIKDGLIEDVYEIFHTAKQQLQIAAKHYETQASASFDEFTSSAPQHRGSENMLNA